MREFLLLMPEIFLGLTMVFVVIGEITYHGEQTRLISGTALIGLAGAFIQTLITYQYGTTQAFSGSLSIDGLALFFKLLFIAMAALAILISSDTGEIARARRTEYSALVLAATIASCLAASASDVLLAFLSLQFVNVLGYFLAGYGKRSVRSTEAAVKYMVFALVSGALMLYGFAILFGATHALSMHDIHQALVATPLSRETMLVVFMLIFLSFSFQFGAFPMHLWAPDVLEGAPTPASAFLSLSARGAGFAVALRLLISVFAQAAPAPGQWQVLGAFDWTRVVGLVAGLTMLVGSLLAFRQVSAKRLVGCLVVAQTGFLLMGLLVLDQVGVAALLYNLVVELFALMGIFHVLSFLYDELKSDKLEDLRGMLARAVPECICLVLFLLCLVGLPPMPGFLGKFALIGVAVRHRWLVLAFVSIAAMALSTVAVARLAFSLIGDFRLPTAAAVAPSFGRKAFLMGVLVPMMLVGVFAEFVLGWAGKSLGFILW